MMSFKRTTLSCCVCVVLSSGGSCIVSAGAVAGDPGPINTERPSFSSSPLALAAGYWQIEAGYQYTHDEDGDSLDIHSLPNALLRYGFYDTFELQLSAAGYSWQEAGDDYQNGFQDAGLGVKWQITDSNAVVPVGLFAGVSLPVGSSGFSSYDFDPSAAVFWSYSGPLELFGTAKVQQTEGVNSLDNAIGASFSLPADTGLFLEYLAGFSEGDGPIHMLNSGFTWQPAENLQLDVNGGIGLNSRADDYYAGMGISYRF